MTKREQMEEKIETLEISLENPDLTWDEHTAIVIEINDLRCTFAEYEKWLEEGTYRGWT